MADGSPSRWNISESMPADDALLARKYSAPGFSSSPCVIGIAVVGSVGGLHSGGNPLTPCHHASDVLQLNVGKACQCQVALEIRKGVWPLSLPCISFLGVLRRTHCSCIRGTSCSGNPRKAPWAFRHIDGGWVPLSSLPSNDHPITHGFGTISMHVGYH